VDAGELRDGGFQRAAQQRRQHPRVLRAAYLGHTLDLYLIGLGATLDPSAFVTDRNFAGAFPVAGGEPAQVWFAGLTTSGLSLVHRGSVRPRRGLAAAGGIGGNAGDASEPGSADSQPAVAVRQGALGVRTSERHRARGRTRLSLGSLLLGLPENRLSFFRYNIAIMRLALAAILLVAPLCAQETPTERDAARDVIQKMNTLEKSIGADKWVAHFSAPDAARDQVAARAKQLMDTELIAMGDDITRHPEIGFQEKRSVGILTDYLKRHRFEVVTGVANLPTAFVARFGKGAPSLGIIVEYDALRGTKGAFHGDQHSTQGPIGMAAAIAIAEWLDRTHTPGSVVVFGCPGEEMMPPVAKTDMFRAGVFDGTDVIVRSHSVSATVRPAAGFGTCCLNIDGVKYTFSGAPAHQMTPWAGRNALEAVIHLFNNIDAARTTMRPEARIQGIITEGGAAPNVVPDRTQADFYVRYPDSVYLAQVREAVDNAARAAALATGTKVKIDNYGQMRDGISVATLAEVGFAHARAFGATHIVEAPAKPQGYDETGTVSSAIPGVGFEVYSSSAANHTYQMEADALTEVGHQGFVVDAQAMSALLYDFATNAEYRAAVKREFSGIQALFGEYQQALQKVYTVPTVPDPR